VSAAVKLSNTTRDVILDATDRIMARYGFRKMTMDDVAREARVSKRTIYHYFRSKEEIGLSSIGRVVDEVHQNLRDIAATDSPFQSKLLSMIVERVMGRVGKVKDYSHSLDELFEVVRPAYMERRQLYFQEEIGMLADVIAKGQEEGVFQPADAIACARVIILASNAFLPYSLSVKELGQPLKIEADLRQMADLLIKGLACPPHSHQHLQETS
jgi:AcrR family transcriptional regulator